jgi:hypothetical protein
VPSLLEEWVEADAQGMRAIRSLWPGDSFYYRGSFHEIYSMQQDLDPQFIWLRCEPEGEPYLVPTHRLVDGERLPYEGEQRLHQPRKLFRFWGYNVLPAILSDEHFRQENPDQGW